MKSRAKGLGECLVCGRGIDPEEAAIGEYEGGPGPVYVPFVEDLRTSGFGLMHLACFAQERGIEALVDVVHERDRRNRKEYWDLYDQTGKAESSDPTGSSDTEHLLP